MPAVLSGNFSQKINVVLHWLSLLLLLLLLLLFFLAKEIKRVVCHFKRLWFFLLKICLLLFLFEVICWPYFETLSLICYVYPSWPFQNLFLFIDWYIFPFGIPWYSENFHYDSILVLGDFYFPICDVNSNDSSIFGFVLEPKVINPNQRKLILYIWKFYLMQRLIYTKKQLNMH